MKTTEQAERTGSRGPRHSPDAPRRRAKFTLVELLVVIVIMTIIMALVVPAFKNFGGGVSGASRMVGSQLRLARQYAIAHRKRIAILMPANEGPSQYHYVAFRSCVLDNSYQWQSWITGTKWEFLPTGSVIAEVDRDSVMHSPPADNSPTVVNGPNPSTFYTDFPSGCRAVVFKPTGQVYSSSFDRYATVADGFVSNGSLTIKNAQNYVTICVDQYTGRVSYKKNL